MELKTPATFEWIKVEDELPGSHNGPSEWSREMVVLVRHSGHSDTEAYYGVRIAMWHTRIRQWFEDGSEIIGMYPTETVVAWQELPDPPPGCRTEREAQEDWFKPSGDSASTESK